MNVFELFAKLTLDKSDYEDGLDDAESKASSMSSRIGGALKVIGTATAAAIGAAAVGVGKLTVTSVESYAEFEQLVGGVEKLFGAGGKSLEEWAAANNMAGDEAVQAWGDLMTAQDTVMRNADNGWRTATLSANDYLNTAITMSGALLGSLDYDSQAAAEYTDRAIIDMADIANTYGYSMDQVSGIYTSVSRGLYQTIDTLTAGAFAGTKEGALDLINSMAELTDIQEQLGITVEEGSLDYDNFVNAMSVYNVYTGVAGTTAREASETIQGSLAMTKAAWTNLVTGMGDSSKNLSPLISNLVSSAKSFVTNVVPVARQALTGIAQIIQEIGPIITNELPGLIDELVPPLLSAAIQIVSALISSLPSILSAITESIPVLLNILIPAMLGMAPDLILAVVELVSGLALGIAEAAPTLIPAIVEAVLLMAETLTSPENMETMLSAAITLAGAIIQGILASIPSIIATMPTILVNLTSGLLSMVPSIIATVISAIGDIIQSACGAVYESGGALIEEIKNVGLSMVENLQNALNGIFEIFESIWNFITEGFAGLDIQLPHIDLPHFSIQGEFSLNPLSVPTLGVDWYAKAMGQPIMLGDATIFGASGGKLLGGGEAGDEMIYGRNNLMKDISEAVSAAIGEQINLVQVYIGEEKIDEFMVNSNQRTNFISGGRG